MPCTGDPLSEHKGVTPWGTVLCCRTLFSALRRYPNEEAPMSRIKNLREEALALHKDNVGKIDIRIKVPARDNDDLTLAYSPGVAEPCKEINKDPAMLDVYTNHSNFVCVVSNGTAVLGLGDIGAGAAMPVMEGKSLLFKRFGDVDAFPLCVDTKDTAKIVELVELVAPTFGGVNLEDIKAPECFEIEDSLKARGVFKGPIFHDDQHGTAVVTLAGLLNALKIVGKNIEDMIRSMAKAPIIFAQANPIPEIWPIERATQAGAKVVATGRSDIKNQINNVLAFPGIFRGAIDVRATDINDAMKIAAAHAIADLVTPEKLSPDYIIPSATDPDVAPAVAAATARAAIESGIARNPVDPQSVAENLRKRLS